MKQPMEMPKEPVGLYDPANERDACGVGFIVSIEGASSNKVLLDAKTMLIRMGHRGACGCDNNTGDGAGVQYRILFSRKNKSKINSNLFKSQVAKI